MAIVRMFVRSGLVTIALMSAAAAAKAICRFTRLPSRSDYKPERTRSQPERSRSGRIPRGGSPAPRSAKSRVV